jgi:parallel beta-helix repeat protein
MRLGGEKLVSRLVSGMLLALLLMIEPMLALHVQRSKTEPTSPMTSVNLLQVSFTYFPEEEAPFFPFVFDALDTVTGEAGISSYAWDFDDGGPVQVVTDSVITHAFTDHSNHTITLNVTDTAGACSSASRTTCYQMETGRHIYVCTNKSREGPWPFKHVDAPYGFVSPGETIRIYGIATYNSWPVQQKDMTFEIRDPYGGLLCTLVNRTDADGAAQVELFLPATSVLGVYTIIARANIRDVIVAGNGKFAVRQSLLPHFSYSAFPSPESRRILFDASNSEPAWNGTYYLPIVNYRWDFGNGNITTVNNPVIEHQYDLAENHKNFTVILKVADAERCRNSTSQEITVWSNIVRVPQDYPTIQEGINNAHNGDTVLVKAGTYLENVIINKTVSLIGENKETTIIDGKGTGNVVYVDQSDVVITEFTVRNGSDGIHVAESNNGIIICKNIIEKTCNAVSLRQSSAGNITDNIINMNEYGLKLWYCGNSTVFGNNLSWNTYGIELAYSSFFTLRDNSLMNNTYGFGVWSYGESPYGSFYDFIHDIDTSNTINGRPIYYWVGRHDEQVPEDAGYVGIINSTNITVKNLSLANNGQGVLIAFSANSTVKNVNASDSMNGIRLVQSRSIIVNRSITTNNDHGIFDILCSNDIIIGNQLLNNGNFGAALENSNSTTIVANLLQGNKYGLCLDGNPPFGGGHDNVVYHNSFINNTYQIYPYTPVPSNNIWDDGFPSGGNYWSDYNDTDSFRGVYQNETGGDGIGDISYNVDEDNTDHYPLMNPWFPPDIAVTNVAPSKTIVGQGTNLGINVIITNQGNKIEVFNVSIYANTTSIMSQILMLSNGNTTLAFAWNTSEFAMGTLTITGYVCPVQGEIDIADNNCTYGTIYLGILGDVNADHYVGIDDLFKVASHFGQGPEDPCWDPVCDINDDCYVCVDDVFIAARHFGQENP